MGTMVEFAIVLMIKQSSEEDRARSADGATKSGFRTIVVTPRAPAIGGVALELKNRKVINTEDAHDKRGSENKVKRERHIFGTSTTTKKIDYMSLIMFSSLYIMFNGIYFNYLC